MDGKEALQFCWFRKQLGHDLYTVYNHLSAFTYQFNMEEFTLLQTTRRIWPTALTGTFHTSVPRYRPKPKKWFALLDFKKRTLSDLLKKPTKKHTNINIWTTVFTCWYLQTILKNTFYLILFQNYVLFQYFTTFLML